MPDTVDMILYLLLCAYMKYGSTKGHYTPVSLVNRYQFSGSTLHWKIRLPWCLLEPVSSCVHLANSLFRGHCQSHMQNVDYYVIFPLFSATLDERCIVSCICFLQNRCCRTQSDKYSSANTICWPNVGVMLANRLRWWPNMGQRLVFAGRPSHFDPWQISSRNHDSLTQCLFDVGPAA